MALTAEPFRGRGAQSALIARRIKKAVEVGCKIVVSETLSIARHSLGNLQKAGFEVACEKEVYGLFADNEPRAASRHRAVVMTPAKWKSRRRTFDNEWTFQVFEEHTSFFTTRMFGGWPSICWPHDDGLGRTNQDWPMEMAWRADLHGTRSPIWRRTTY
jgi:hypothetical protein